MSTQIDGEGRTTRRVGGSDAAVGPTHVDNVLGSSMDISLVDELSAVDLVRLPVTCRSTTRT